MKHPDSLVLDLICWLQPAMIYVALSRVQCLEQLFILEKLPIEKIKPWPDAILEKDDWITWIEEGNICLHFQYVR